MLETLLALGLSAVLAGTGVTRMVVLVRSARLTGAARSVATALRLARARALAQGGGTEVRFDAARGFCETRDAAGALLETRRLPPGIVFAALPVRRRVLFGGLGTADNATIALGGGPAVRRVIVNQRGRVRVQ